MSSPANRSVATLFLLFTICSFIACPKVHAADPAGRPQLTISNIRTDNRQGRTVLHLQIRQQTPSPLTLQVPILVTTGTGNIRFTPAISALKTELAFVLPDPPLSVILDPDNELMRQPDPAELPPRLARLLEAAAITAVLATPESRTMYAPLLESLQGRQLRVTTASEIRNSELHGTTLLFLGADNAAGRTLFAGPPAAVDGFALEVHTNPLDRRHVAVLVTSRSEEETAAAVRQLPRYGDASALVFKKGRLVQKRGPKQTAGQRHTLELLPAGAPVSAFGSFEKTVDRLAAARLVLIGETHTSLADHRLQLRIIQSLYRKNPHLAIGMEMFPRTSQPALDAYILGDTPMDEKSFLKQSGYFQAWGYDWRLYRDIVNFARTNRIRVIGLNLDRTIPGTVFTTGSTDTLPPEQRQELPAERDLDLPGYVERLSEMHAMHGLEGHGHGTLSGFIQAQGLWDETMAQNIATFIAGNPATRMVVLAGTQHVRKDSGIPPRVTRRQAVSQSTVINILSDDAPEDIASVADFVFLEAPFTLPPAARLGLVLEPAGDTRLRVAGFSPHGKAEEAGLKEDDILLEIDNHPVYDMEDVRIAMIDAGNGDTVTVTVRRGNGARQAQDMEFHVIAQTMKTEKPHP